MAVQVEMWEPIIKEELFADNQFLNHLQNGDEYVIGGKIVHIPQAGSPSAVQRNRSSLPATITQRSDTDIVYVLDEFTTDPKLIPNADKVELSYNKTRSVIRQDTGVLMEDTGDWIIYKNLENIPAGGKIATTGENAAATAPGATGTRKILTEADLRKAKVYLNKQNIPKRERYCLLSSEMIDHLAADKDLKYAFQKTYDLKTGIVARLEGFNLLDRSKVGTLATDLSLKAPGAATATTDLDLGFFWQKDFCQRNLGDITMFDEYGRPEYYGDIFSFLIRASGRANRSDNKGYGVIYGAA